MSRFTGSEPQVGEFDARITPNGLDWCIFVKTSDNEWHERWCSTWRNEPCNGLTKVYAILREYGFTLDGFQTATVHNIGETN